MKRFLAAAAFFVCFATTAFAQNPGILPPLANPVNGNQIVWKDKYHVTDYGQPPCGKAISGMLKSVSGVCQQATSNSDYAPSNNPIFTGSAQIAAPVFTNLTQFVANGYPRMAQGLTTVSTGDGWTPSDGTFFGGLSDMDSASVSIRGLPYGPLGNGSLLSIIATDRPLYGSREGIAPNGIGVTSTYNSYDAVNEYNQAGNNPPRIVASSALVDTSDGVAHTVTYVANRANFSPPLSAAAIALLRPNMHVLTNSVGTTNSVRTALGVANAQGRIPLNLYGGQIIPGGPGVGWDTNGAWIAVDGWVVPNSGNAATTQVPSSTYDTVRTNIGAAALFIGTYTKNFARNTVCSMPPSGQAATDSNNPKGMIGANVLECEIEEADDFDYGTVDFITTHHGYTYQYTPLNGAKPTLDSYGFHSGGPLPHHFIADELPTVPFLESNSSIFNGNVGPANGTAIGTKTPYFEMQKYPNGAINERIAFWLQREVLSATSTAGPGTHSERLGVFEGGNKGDPTTGALQEQIVFGGANLIGGLGFCPYGYGLNDGNLCPLVVTASGAVKGILTTPASSAAACTAGQYEDDANYHYVCVAINTWKRVALTAF